MSSEKLDFNSRLIHGGNELMTNIKVQTFPFIRLPLSLLNTADEGAKCFAGESDGFVYTRLGNPTISALEKLVADLENGYGGIATSSGMAAANTIYLAFLKAGDHIVSTDAVYGPARGLMENYYSQFGIQSTYINTTDIDTIRKAIKPNTKVIYIETPANPTMDITDLKACSLAC